MIETLGGGFLAFIGRCVIVMFLFFSSVGFGICEEKKRERKREKERRERREREKRKVAKEGIKSILCVGKREKH